MFMRPATQNVLCCLVKGNTFVLMGFTNFLFSTVCVRATFPYGITFMMHDKAYNSPSPLQHTARNPSCPKVMAVTTGIITHFSFSAAASLYSPPCLHEICLHPAVREYIYQVKTKLFSGWWCCNECPLLDLFHQPRMCAHIRANPLILPPVLLSISGGSRVVGVDGC